MKKLCLFVCMICCFGATDLYAGLCKQKTHGRCNSSNEYLNIRAVATDGCFECDDDVNDCGANRVFVAKDAAIGGQEYDFEWREYTCKLTGEDDYWTKSGRDVKYCSVKDKELAKNADQDSYASAFGNVTDPILVKTPSGAVVGGFVDGDYCINVSCKSEYKEGYDIDGKYTCIPTNINCRKSDDSWAIKGEEIPVACDAELMILAPNGKLTSDNNIANKNGCIAKCEDNGWNIKLNKGSCERDFIPDEKQKQCVVDQKAKEEKQQAAEKTAQASCEKSGGKWQNKKCQCDINRFLVESIPGKTCTCMSGYAYATGTSVCQMTDNEKLKQICNSIPGAKWLDTGNKCDCGTSKPMLIFNGTECVQDPEYLACVKAQPATKWNESGKKCVCTTANYVWNSDLEECEENEKLINQKNSNRIKQDIAGLKTNILASMDGWKKTLSVWKTSKGDFNTARLASDSVAGVVLGTAGGLITSKVVKKNQVKTGFEDISCTIGGQNVADWSDEFTVGIQ